MEWDKTITLFFLVMYRMSTTPEVYLSHCIREIKILLWWIGPEGRVTALHGVSLHGALLYGNPLILPDTNTYTSSPLMRSVELNSKKKLE